MMKYCPNCGHEINDKQTFCNNCGHKLTNNESHQSFSERTHKPNRTDHTQSPYVNNDYYQNNKSSGIGKVLLVILIIVVLGLLLFGAYFAYQKFIGNSNHNTARSQSNTHSNHNSQAQGAQIDIFSDDFDQQFIKSPSKTGYAGVYDGMSRSEVENKYGHSSKVVSTDFGDYEKYGDIGVQYKHNVVDQVVITPDNISESDYINVYGEPDKRENDLLIYDAYKDNDFSIIVNIKNNQVAAIENIDQLPDYDADSDQVTSKDDAEDIAEMYLDDTDWIHSVDEGTYKYRVNYGEEDEDKAHRGLIIDKHTGSISEWDGDIWDKK